MANRTAREITHRLRRDLGVSLRHVGELFGRTHTTVQRWALGEVSAGIADDYLNRIREVRLFPGYAVVVVDMPKGMPMARYEREIADTKNTADVTNSAV